MKRDYKKYYFKEITQNIIDSIEVGDYIKINNELRGKKVCAVSKNFILIAVKSFDSRFIYSIISKNKDIGGLLYRDASNCRFGWYGSDDYEIHYFEDDSFFKDYLNYLENEKIEIGRRNNEPIFDLYIKKRGI